jgi:hypothetical protein
MKTVLMLGLMSGALSSCSLALADDPFAAYRSLKPGAGFDVAGKKLTIEHLDLELASGTLWELQAGNGRTVGYLFDGAGRWTYRTDDPLDQQTFAKNIDLQVSALQHSDKSVFDELSRALLLVSAPFSADQLGAPVSAAPGSDLQHWVAKMRESIEQDGEGIEHALAQAHLNGDPRQTAHVELIGRRAEMAYAVYPARSQRERLWAPVQAPGMQYRSGRSVSSQMSRDAVRRVVAPYMTTNIDWDVATPDNKRGTITTTLQLKIQLASQRVLGFALVNNRDNADTANWTSEKNLLKVKSVTDSNGKPLAFSHRYHELMVDLGEAPAVGSTVTVRVDSDADIFTAFNYERGHNYVALYGDSWYPSPLGWSGERFTFRVRATCKQPFYPVSTGETVSLVEKGEQIEMVAKSDAPVSDFALIMGKYTLYELTNAQGVKIRLHGYGPANVKGLEEIAKLAEVYLRFMGDQLGPYPWKELDILEIPQFLPFYSYGVSPSGLVYIGDAATRGGGATEYETLRELPALLAHELAHQWWGHKVWPATEYDNWIAEGLAEYTSGIAMQYVKIDEQHARGKPIRGWKALRSSWSDYAKWCEKGASIEAANKLSGGNAGELRRCLLYDRSPLVIHMIRSWVGDKGFFAILRQFIKNNEYRPATSDDFAKAASQVLRQDMQWFVDDWIKQPGTPEIKVQATVGTDAAGKPALICKAEQVDKAHPKRFYVPIHLSYAGGQPEVKMCFVSGAVSEQTLPIAGTPTKIEVDPTQTALARYK